MSRGGTGSFFLGLIMMIGGGYMLLNAIVVRSSFRMSSRMYDFHAFGSNIGLTSGTILIPLILGIGIIFYNSKNILGWVLALGSLAALIFGVISSVHIGLRTMSIFDLIVILVLAVGGLGMFLRSLR